MTLVIKLGGSLLSDGNSLIQCLETIEKCKRKIVIVPGGGVFADQVRATQQQWQFNNFIAHEMAILAMKQMALLFKGIKPSWSLAENSETIHHILLNHSTVIWSPHATLFGTSNLNANWDVTSDSIAAWLATQLNAQALILVKSAPIPEDLTHQQMQEKGLVDQAFVRFTQDSSYHVTLVNKHQFNEHRFIERIRHFC